MFLRGILGVYTGAYVQKISTDYDSKKTSGDGSYEGFEPRWKLT